MTKSLIILGRQPKLGLAELESLFGKDQINPFGSNAAVLNIAPEKIPFSRLGGAIKLGKILHEFDTTSWQVIHDYLVKILPDHLQYVPDGEKLQLGLSTYGVNVSAKKQLATALDLKKVAREHNQSVRIVPNKTNELSTAQVLHNKLFTPSGWELFFVQAGGKVVMAMTTNIQDIEAYTARDQKRPKRDAKVGMLPPKLAQIILNLATRNPNTIEQKTTHPPVILDPFCGTGVILQEAMLMDYHVIGTDLDQRMVDYSQANLEWLRDSMHVDDGFLRYLAVADATSQEWFEIENVDCVAAETYLGRPFSHAPDEVTLEKVIRDVNTIHKKFFENLAKQTKQGTTMCLAVPAWKTKYGFKHLPVIDQLTDMGYTRTSFAHAANEDLIYHREGQIVARELLVLTRK